MDAVRFLVVFLAAIPILSGCLFGGGSPEGAVFRADAQRTGVYGSEPVEQMQEVLWRYPAEMATLAPALADGVLYFSASDSLLHAVDAETGRELWRFGFGGSVPTIDGGVLYFGSDSTLFSVDAATAEEQWRLPMRGLVMGSPVVVDDVLYVCSGRDIHALRHLEQQEKWRYTYTGTLEVEGDEDDKFRMTEADAEDKMRSMACPGALAVADGLVFAAMLDGTLLGLDARTGQEVWRTEATPGDLLFAQAPAVSEGVVYLAGGSQTLRALSAQQGQEKWAFEADSQIFSAPAVAHGRVYLVTQEGALHAVDARTGQALWTFEGEGDPNSVASSPVVAGGIVYYGAHDGTLYAVDAATGQERWHFGNATGSGRPREADDPENRLNSTPILVDGVVYFGSAEGYIYALR